MGTRPHESHLVVREVGADTIVHDRRTHRAHCLGPLAAAVWRGWDVEESAAATATRGEAALGEALAGLAVVTVVAPTPEAAAATCTRQIFQTCQKTADCWPPAGGGSHCCVATGLFGNRCLPTGSGTRLA